ncbi:hypothetical protein Tco_1573735, partial [Tanacetum coccineum]
KSDGKDEDIVLEYINDPIVKVDPVTPKSATPEPPRAERRVPDMGPKQELAENPYILSTLAPQLWPFMRHSITLVCYSAIRTLVASLVLISWFKEMKSRGLSGSNYKTLKSMLLELLTCTDPSYLQKDQVVDFRE